MHENVCVHMHSSTETGKDKSPFLRFHLLSHTVSYTDTDAVEYNHCFTLTLEVKFLIALLRSFTVATLPAKRETKGSHQSVFLFNPT